MAYTITFYTETCGNLAIPADEGIKIIEYSDPAVNGSNVTYGCLLDFVLYTSICMNGEWAPNPEDFELNCSGHTLALYVFLPCCCVVAKVYKVLYM